MRIADTKKIVILFYFVLVFSTLFSHSFSQLDPDFGWHLRIGKDISETGQVPTDEKYNFTLEGRQWVDHEWLTSFITYRIYDLFDYVGTSIFFALIALLTFWLLINHTLRSAEKGNLKIFFAYVFGGLGIYASLGHLGVRFQEITLLNLILLLIIIRHYTQTGSTKVLFWLLPLFYFWSSAHAGFLIGIFTLFFWITIKFLENIFFKSGYFAFLDFSERIANEKIFKFFFFSIISAAVTLFTPYGTDLYAFLADYSNTFYLTHIAEWLPMYAVPFNYGQLVYVSLALSSLLLILILMRTTGSTKDEPAHYPTGASGPKITFWELASLIVFMIISVKSKRNFPLFFIVSLPVITKIFSSTLHFPLFQSANHRFFLHVRNVLLILFLGGLSLFILIKTTYIHEPFQSFCDSYPCQAVSFLKSSPEYSELRTFNEYAWGGYLTWVWPEKKLFIDGRLPQFPLAEKTMLEEYYAFMDPDLIESKIHQYSIEMFLIKKSSVIKLKRLDKILLYPLNDKILNERISSTLPKYLSDSENWKLVYEDKISQIFVKN